MPDDFPTRLGEHLMLVAISVSNALVMGTGLALVARHHPVFRALATTLANGVQTIPSLALLAFLIPLLGIGTMPALAALVLYAVLPIYRATLTGLAQVEPELVEAARTLGMREAQILWQVEIPQASPVLVSGLRTAMVWSVGTATLSAFIGAGGLGQYITAGLSLNDTRLLMTGAVPAAVLALALDSLLGWCEERTQAWKNGTS
jgi:osmoprotectant transport system permease protein